MATYPQDAIPNTTTATFSSMADKKPDRGYKVEKQYDVNIFVSEAGYERRSLRSRRSKRSFTLKYTNVSGLVKQAIQNFYIARSGSFESFLLDLSHIGETGSLFVRFEGALDIVEVQSGLTNPEDNIFNISFNLQETYT
jgi:hypothetical protein